MHANLRRGAALITVAALLVAGSTGARLAQPVTSSSGALAAGGNVDWPRFGNTADNTRFSTLTQVNTGNVSKLGVAWTMPEGSNITEFENDPVVINGVMYVTTGLDQVRAVEAATGKLIWQYTPKVDFYKSIHGGGGGSPTARGVEVANNVVYLLTYDDQLIALQASTGEVLWHTTVANASDGYNETSPPTYWHGLLFVGSAVSDSGLRGFVAAYDAKTGKQVWRFYTVPAPGHGWEPATGAHGGGDVWMPSVVDDATGTLYFGTGNPSPDEDNSMRPGCDPWVDSIVALDARTGKFRWAHTEVCNDVWDYDSHQEPILLNVTINGKTVRAVGHGNKSGVYFIYDAATGKILAKSPHLSDWSVPHLKPSPQGAKVCPGAAGGIEYSPPAYSPQTHLVYAPGINLCMIFTLGPKDQTALHKLGGIDLGGSIAPTGKPSGFMAAVDVATGKIAWKTKVAMPMVGGALATAGNLVFSGADDGYFYAFDATSGKILWRAKLGLAFGAAPMAYEVNGTEYIAIADGGSVISGLDGAPEGGGLVVFKLGGAPVKPLPAISTALTPSVGLPSLAGLARINPWMYADAKGQRLVLKVVAGATPNNNGFNFNGYAKGQANFVVPLGWALTIEFSNKAALPHSMALASSATANPKLPLFGIAPVVSPNPTSGTAAGVTQVLGLAAIPAGKYYLVCLVPGHIQSGMWDYFTISKTATMPSISTTGM